MLRAQGLRYHVPEMQPANGSARTSIVDLSKGCCEDLKMFACKASLYAMHTKSSWQLWLLHKFTRSPAALR